MTITRRSTVISNNTITLGMITITDANDTDTIQGQTTGRVDAAGTAHAYAITGPGRLKLRVLDVTWDNGERDIRAIERNGSPQRFDRLCRGLRLSVMPHTGTIRFVELRQARMKGPDWSNLFGADLAQLDLGAKTSVTDALVAAGAKSVGPRSEVIHDIGRRGNYLCASFPAKAISVPVVAYALTRVLPVLHKVPA